MQLIDGITDAFVGRLADRAREAEELRRLPEATVADLTASGLTELLVPKRFGGQEADFPAILDPVRRMAHGCTSSAWTIGFYTLHYWMLALFGERALRVEGSPKGDDALSSQLAMAYLEESVGRVRALLGVGRRPAALRARCGHRQVRHAVRRPRHRGATTDLETRARGDRAGTGVRSPGGVVTDVALERPTRPEGVDRHRRPAGRQLHARRARRTRWCSG